MEWSKKIRAFFLSILFFVAFGALCILAIYYWCLAIRAPNLYYAFFSTVVFILLLFSSKIDVISVIEFYGLKLAVDKKAEKVEEIYAKLREMAIYDTKIYIESLANEPLTTYMVLHDSLQTNFGDFRAKIQAHEKFLKGLGIKKNEIQKLFAPYYNTELYLKLKTLEKMAIKNGGVNFLRRAGRLDFPLSLNHIEGLEKFLQEKNLLDSKDMKILNESKEYCRRYLGC